MSRVVDFIARNPWRLVAFIAVGLFVAAIAELIIRGTS